MTVDTCIAKGSPETRRGAARLSVCKMLVRLETAPGGPEVEVDQVDPACVFAEAEHEVLGLDVAVQDAVRVDVLHSCEL